MKTTNPFIFRIVFLGLFLNVGLMANAKKVVCVDDAGNAFLNAHEGWERQNTMPGDTIVIGGDLTECMDLVEDGDELVIITHGVGRGEGFIWGSANWSGFGDGPGEMPVPEDWAELDSVKVHLCFCQSARDKDGPGEGKSMVDDLKDELPGTGNAVDGFEDLAVSPVCWDVICNPPATEADRQKALAALKKDYDDNHGSETSFMDWPPPSRPGSGYNMLTVGQGVVDDAVGEGKCTLVILPFKKPVNIADYEEIAEALWGNIEEAIEAVKKAMKDLLGYYFLAGCSCPDGHNGLVPVYFDDVPHLETVAYTGPFFPGEGVWRSEDAVLLNGFPEKIQAKDPYGPSFRFQFFNSVPLPPIGATIEFPLDGIAVLTMSLNGGNSYHSYTATVAGMCSLSAPLFPAGDDPNQYVNIEIIELQMEGGTLPSAITIQKDPLVPASGVVVARPDPNGTWWIDSFFDVTYRVNFLDNGLSVTSAAPVRNFLHCPTASNGCTNSSAGNYDECAMFDNGICTLPISGCTYPEAANYNPYASSDNGTCITTPLCPSDISGDGAVNIVDLLLFLSDFGILCN